MEVVFNKQPKEIKNAPKKIFSFNIGEGGNIDLVTVESFGEEWKKFNQFNPNELQKIGADYFDILPKELLNKQTSVLDVGCGSGRWAAYLAPYVGSIDCVDPSNAVYIAAEILKDQAHVRISQTDVDNLPFPDNSFDLVYSLGVLHHIPDTKAAMQKCVEKVKKNRYFLVYLYYNLDNRGPLFKTVFRLSAVARNFISKRSTKWKKIICDGIALGVYFPLAKTARLMQNIGAKNIAKKLPLSYYSDKSFWIMKNDALDRFGTPLEQRFSRQEIITMMASCGLTNIIVSEHEPYWHAIGQKV